MKVLITGGTGFLGQYVIQKLLENELATIVATTRNLNNLTGKIQHFRLEYRAFEIGHVGPETFKELGAPDMIIHLAWEGLPHYKNESHLTKNLPEQKKFLSTMLESGLKDLTVTGTCFEYGMLDGELSETMETKPDNPYGQAKDELRRFLQSIQKQQSFSLKWLRLFYMYGEGQSPNSLFTQLEKAISEKATTFNMSGGEQIRDFLPVEEMATRIVQCSLQTKVDGVINCCSGQPVKVREFVTNFLRQKNYQLKLNLGFYPYPDYEPMTFWGNNQKLNEALNAK